MDKREDEKRKKILEAGQRYKQTTIRDNARRTEEIDSPTARQERKRIADENRAKNGNKTFIKPPIYPNTSVSEDKTETNSEMTPEIWAAMGANSLHSPAKPYSPTTSGVGYNPETKELVSISFNPETGEYSHGPYQPKTPYKPEPVEMFKDPLPSEFRKNQQEKFLHNQGVIEKSRAESWNEYEALDDTAKADLRIAADGIDAEKLTSGFTGLYVATFGGEEYGKALQRVTDGNEARQRLIDRGYNPNQVDNWIDFTRTNVNYEYTKSLQEDFAEIGKKSPVATTLASIGLWGATLPLDVISTADDAFDGTINEPNLIDTAVQTDEMAQQGVTEGIAEHTKLGAWLYNTGMSGVKSGIASVLPGGAFVLGADAATNAMRNYSSKGLSSNEALVGGLAAGVFEYVFERISIGNFDILKDASPVSLKNVTMNIAKSMGVNASEEAATELANIVYDTIINDGLSDYDILVKEYRAKGMSDEEAQAKALEDLSLRVLEAGASGLVMGAGFGTVGSTVGYVSNYAPISSVGTQAMESGSVDSILDAAKLAPKGTAPYQALDYVTKKQNKGKNLTAHDIGHVAVATQDYIRENAPELNGVFKSAKTSEDVDALYNAERYRLEQMPVTPRSAIKALDADYKAAKSAVENYNTSGARAMLDGSLRNKTYSDADTVKTRKPTIGKTEAGEIVSVSSIESIEDGNITVKTSEGTTQELNIRKDIKSVDAQTLWTNAAQYFPDAESAQAFIDNYDGGSIADYTKAFKDYYHLAATGMTLSQINEHEIAPYYDLSNKAQAAAVELGQKAISYQQGVVDLTARPKTKAQQLQVNMLDSIGKHIGMNVVVVDTMSKHDGFYRPGTNQIVVAMDSSSGAILRTAGHETYHFVKEEMSDRAKDIETFVLDTLKKNKGEKWINDRLSFYEKQGYKTKEAQVDELVADSLFDAFTNKRAVKDFATENQSLAKKLVNHIQKLLSDIKNIINKLVASGKYDEIKAWQDDIDSLEKLNNMFLDVLDELAAKNVDAPTKTKNTAEAVKSTKHNVITKSDVNAAQSIGRKSINALSSAELNSLSAFAKKYWNELDAKSPFFRAWFGDWRESDKTPSRVVKISKSSYNTETRSVVNKDMSKDDVEAMIKIDDAIFNDSISYARRFGDEKQITKLLSHIDEIISNAIYLDTHLSEKGKANKKGSATFMHYLYCPVEFNGAPFIAKITIEEYDVDSKRRAYNAQRIKMSSLPRAHFSTLNKDAKARNIRLQDDEITVADLFALVKQNDKNFTPNPASKIVNPDGTPKVMYHGTQSSFTAFDKKKAKSYGYYGKGFYFTDSESHAGQYGNAMAVYLDVKNPLEPGKNKLTKNQLRSFLEAVAENEDYDIWNYGTEDISEIIGSIYKDDTFAVLQDVNATAIGDLAEAISLFNSVNGTNYDGVITPTETVVYEPTQIKSATDNIGTFDKSNPDIRYSTKREQLDIINETNPAQNSYNTWIRTVDDIKTLSETLEDKEWDYEEFNPDLTRNDIQKAIRNGRITVYSSKPIENGVFVSPSRMEAESYSGNGKIYEKTVDINDVAWIDPTQGQFAKVEENKDDIRYSSKRTVASGKKKSYNKHTTYNQFNSVAMNWSRQADRMIGDLAIFAYDYDDFRLIEATENGYVELARGKYKNVRSIYERAYRNSTDTLYGHLKEFRAEKRRNIWNLQPYENRGYDDRGSGQVGRKELQSDSTGSNEHSRLGDKEESLKSTKRELSISEEVSNYILDTKEYQEVMKLVDERFKLTNSVKLDEKAVDRLAGRILKKSNSNFSREQLTSRLTALFDFIANSRELSWEDVTQTAASIAKDVLTESQTIDRSMQQEYADVLKLMRESRVYISPEVRAEINHNFGSLEAFRRRLGSKLKITVTDESAVPLDAFWRELAENRPEMFEENTNYLDMPSKLVDFFEMTSPQYINPYNIEMDMDEAAYDLALQIYDEYFNIPEVKTEAQKYAAKLEMLRGRYNAKIKEIHNSYRERIKEIRTELKAENKNQIAVTKELYRRRNENYRNKQKETRDKQKLRAQIYRSAQNLTDKLVNPTDQKHIPQELIPLVNDFAKTIIESNIFSYKKTNKLLEIFSKSPDDTQTFAVRDDFADDLRKMREMVDGKRLSELSVSELVFVKEIAYEIRYMVVEGNKLFATNKRATVAEYGDKIYEEFDKQAKGKKRIQATTRFKALNEAQIGILKPQTFFELLESPTLLSVYHNLENSQYDWVVKHDDIKNHFADFFGKYDYQEWWKKVIEVNIGNRTIPLTMDEALSIYALSKRPDAVRHLLGGGFVKESDGLKELKEYKKKHKDEFNEKEKESPKKFLQSLTSVSTQITDADIRNIVDKLRQETDGKAIQYADAVVKYMSSDMAKQGNKATMTVYGREKFKEDYYFPIISDPNYLHFEPAKGLDERMSGKSFTKSTTDYASNPIIISSFTEIAVKHCEDMATYSTFLAPTSDFTRIYNYKYAPNFLYSPTPIRSKIQEVYGRKATKYIEQFLKDVNGGVVQGTGAGTINTWVGRVKRDAVLGSFQVVIQQPSAYLRASAELSFKHILYPRFKAFSPAMWDELKQYAPVARIKEIGGFETNMGKTASEDVMGKYANRDKWVVVKARDKVNDILGKAPELMDRWTWVAIWQATKSETQKKHPDLAVGSEEFLRKAGERFTYIVNETQVYDSVFSRSHWLRSRDSGVKQILSFKNEQLTTFNMLYKAMSLPGNENRGKARIISRVVVSVMSTIVFNGILKSLTGAIRDDDDEKSFIEKYLGKLVNNILMDTAGVVPFFDEFVNLLQSGFESTEMTDEYINRLVETIRYIFDKDKDVASKIKMLVSYTGLITGIPTKNLWREANSIKNIYKSIVENEPTTSKGVKYSILDEIDFATFKWLDVPNMAEQYVIAYLDGDKKHLEKTKNNLLAKYEDEVNSKIKSATGKLYKEGRITKDQAGRILEKMFGLDEDEAYWEVKEWETQTDSAYTSLYKAIENGEDFDDEIDELLEHGKEEKDIKSAITRKFEPIYKELYESDRKAARELKNNLLDVYAEFGSEPDIDAWLEEDDED